MSVTLITAVSKNGVIGDRRRKLWHLPGDLAEFKRRTEGTSIIIGLTTFKEIGKPLPNRENIVLSDDDTEELKEVIVARSFSEAVQRASKEEIFVIGGALTYESSMCYISKIVLTEVDGIFDGDIFFPDIDWDEWSLIRRSAPIQGRDDTHPYSLLEFTRKAKQTNFLT